MSEGFRWVTAVHPSQPELEVTFMAPGPPLDADAAEFVRRQLEKGAMGGLGLAVDDCRKTYEQLSAKGVTFLQEPSDRPYGVEAVMRQPETGWCSWSPSRTRQKTSSRSGWSGTIGGDEHAPIVRTSDCDRALVGSWPGGCGSGSGSSSASAPDALAGVRWADHVRDCSVASGGSGLGTVDRRRGQRRRDGRRPAGHPRRG
jgi:hypothetical protein